MPYFTDTNVPVGFTVVHDKWHESSKNFYQHTEDEIFWSNLVRDENFEKLKDIVKTIDIFLKNTSYLLRNNSHDFVNYEEFENFVLKHTQDIELDNFKKINILKQFWSKYNFFEGLSTTAYLKFNQFSDEFKKIYFERNEDLRNIMQLHDCGLKNYLKYQKYVAKLSNNEIHDPNYKIIIDAHDCGLSHENLIFVTNDMKMLDAISRIDTSHLHIVEFRTCN